MRCCIYYPCYLEKCLDNNSMEVFRNDSFPHIVYSFLISTQSQMEYFYIFSFSFSFCLNQEYFKISYKKILGDIGRIIGRIIIFGCDDVYAFSLFSYVYLSFHISPSYSFLSFLPFHSKSLSSPCMTLSASSFLIPALEQHFLLSSH